MTTAAMAIIAPQTPKLFMSNPACFWVVGDGEGLADGSKVGIGVNFDKVTTAGVGFVVGLIVGFTVGEGDGVKAHEHDVLLWQSGLRQKP